MSWLFGFVSYYEHIGSFGELIDVAILDIMASEVENHCVALAVSIGGVGNWAVFVRGVIGDGGGDSVFYFDLLDVLENLPGESFFVCRCCAFGNVESCVLEGGIVKHTVSDSEWLCA